MQEWLFHLITMLASVDVTSLLFAMMFKWLPDVAVDWYDVWLGAVTTAVLFELGKSAIGFYIGKQGLESTYGAAASIIVILIWVYYSSQIILMGAEVTHAFAKHKGSSDIADRPSHHPTHERRWRDQRLMTATAAGLFPSRTFTTSAVAQMKGLPPVTATVVPEV